MVLDFPSSQLCEQIVRANFWDAQVPQLLSVWKKATDVHMKVPPYSKHVAEMYQHCTKIHKHLLTM